MIIGSTNPGFQRISARLSLAAPIITSFFVSLDIAVGNYKSAMEGDVSVAPKYDPIKDA